MDALYIAAAIDVIWPASGRETQSTSHELFGTLEINRRQGSLEAITSLVDAVGAPVSRVRDIQCVGFGPQEIQTVQPQHLVCGYYSLSHQVC